MNLNPALVRAIARVTGKSSTLVRGLADSLPADITLLDFVRTCEQETQR